MDIDFLGCFLLKNFCIVDMDSEETGPKKKPKDYLLLYIYICTHTWRGCFMLHGVIALVLHV